MCYRQHKVKLLKIFKGCAYCGQKFNTKDKHRSFSIDHIKPKTAGGTDDLNNLVAACFRCNGKKGGRNMFEWYIRQPTFRKYRLARIVDHILSVQVGAQVSLGKPVGAPVSLGKPTGNHPETNPNEKS